MPIIVCDMTKYYLSEPACELLQELGKNLEIAIDTRESKMAFAQRVGVSRETIRKMCQGKPGLDWGVLIASLDALGLLDHLRDVGTPEKDQLGQSIRVGRVSANSVTLDSDF